MRLKNFHTVIANTSPAMKQQIRNRMDLQKKEGDKIEILLGDRKNIERVLGLVYDREIDWPELMDIVEAIEDLGYNIAINKYSCSVSNTKTNQTVVSNTNPYRIYTKKEAVWKACNEFIKIFNTL